MCEIYIKWIGMWIFGKKMLENWCCFKLVKFVYFCLKGKFKGVKIKMDKVFKME